MSRPSPAPAPPYARAHVTRGLRPPCRQDTPTPPTPKARHSYAPPMRRARPTRTPREPHGCHTHAPQTRRASVGLLTHIACHNHGHPPTLRPSRGARTSPRESRIKAGVHPCGCFQSVRPAAHPGIWGYGQRAFPVHRAKRKPKRSQIEAKSSLNRCQIEPKSRPNRAQVDAKSSPSRCQTEPKSMPSQSRVKGKSKASRQEPRHSRNIAPR